MHEVYRKPHTNRLDSLVQTRPVAHGVSTERTNGTFKFPITVGHAGRLGLEPRTTVLETAILPT